MKILGNYFVTGKHLATPPAEIENARVLVHFQSESTGTQATIPLAPAEAEQYVLGTKYRLQAEEIVPEEE